MFNTPIFDNHSADMSEPNREQTPVTRHNARVGVVLFLIYCAIYAIYVMLSAFHGDVMAKQVVGGVNLAIIYGFALIGLAFAMALLYMVLCKSDRNDGGTPQ